MKKKYCIFCGSELIENALFCAECGSKIPKIEDSFQKDKIEINEENLELSLLSKVNFESNNKNKEPIISIKKNPQNKPIIIKQTSVNIPLENVLNIKKTTSVDNNSLPLTDSFEYEEVIIEKKEEETIDEIDFMELENIFNKTEKEYVPPILEGITQNEEILEEKIELPKIKKPYEKLYSKRNISEQEEVEEEYSKESFRMKTCSSITYEDDINSLTEDEKADLEKYKKYTEEVEKEEKIDISLTKGEGRKTNGRKKDARENIDIKIAQRKINKIEHEEYDKKNKIDPNYDGYYENVKPIDFDKQKDNTALIKVILTAFVFVLLASISFYLLITFFAQ